MYRQIEDFLTDWGTEVDLTIGLMELLTEASIKQKIHPQGRDLGHVAWHIVQTIPEIAHKAGLFEENTLENEKVPPFLTAIIASYKGQANRLIEAIHQKWQDTDLATKVLMCGEEWTYSKVLQVLIKHQIHHRGQMTVLMRQANLKVLEMYKSTKGE